MNPEEQWKALCAEYADADKAHREALDKVTAKMLPGAGRNSSMQDLDAWEAARARWQEVDRRMDELVRRTFGA